MANTRMRSVSLRWPRRAFSDEASLVAWLGSDAGATAAAAPDPLGGRTGNAQGRAPMSFARTPDERHVDADAIAVYTPVHLLNRPASR
jgi:hypothetical protein